MANLNIIQKLEQERMRTNLPDFRPGDTLVVQVKVKEGDRERLQAFEGVTIGKRNRGLNSAFTVRRMAHGVGVERTFQTHSPLIESITVKRRGDVRQAKLYYLRELTGRKARIREKISLHKSLPEPASPISAEVQKEPSAVELAKNVAATSAVDATLVSAETAQATTSTPKIADENSETQDVSKE